MLSAVVVRYQHTSEWGGRAKKINSKAAGTDTGVESLGKYERAVPFFVI